MIFDPPTTPVQNTELMIQALTALSCNVTSGWTSTNEKALQRQVDAALWGRGKLNGQRKKSVPFARERKIPGSTLQPDFMIGYRAPYIAVEVKIAGTRAQLLRQIDSYAALDDIGAILVITTKSSHRDLPDHLRGKPVHVFWATSALAKPNTPPPAQVSTLVSSSPGWVINLQPHQRMRFKRCFPRVSASSFGPIGMDGLDETARDLVWFISRYPVAMSEQDRVQLYKQAARHDAKQARLVGLLAGKLTPRAFKMALPPREYQKIAAELALQSGGLLLADEVGLGKTISAIAMLTDPSTRPALVVTLTHLPEQWAKEIKRFAPDLNVHVIKKGQPYDVTRPKRGYKVPGDIFHVPLYPDPSRPFPDVIITSYSKLAGWGDVIAPVVKSVIYDEIQELRHGDNTKRGAAAYHITNSTDYRLGLSATPIHNYGDEYFAVMQAVRPGALGTKAEFLRERCVSRGLGKWKLDDPAALGAWAREQGLMLRRSRADVGRELPQLRNVPVCIEARMDAINQVKKETADLAKLILGNSASIFERGRAGREISWKLRQATGIAKAPEVAALVKMLIADGAPKILLDGWHREVYSIWLDLLSEFKPVLYTGSESVSQKRRSAEAFISGKSQVLIMSLRSGAGIDGLQLSGCRDVVFGELDWSPQVHHQFTGRIDRDGQPDQVTAWWPHCDAGSDPVIMDVLGVKREQSDGVLDPAGVEVGAKVDASQARSLAKRILGVR